MTTLGGQAMLVVPGSLMLSAPTFPGCRLMRVLPLMHHHVTLLADRIEGIGAVRRVAARRTDSHVHTREGSEPCLAGTGLPALATVEEAGLASGVSLGVSPATN